jgi:hypothetical protein
MSGWPDKVENELLPYFRRRNELSIQNDCLLLGIRVIVPKQGHVNLLDELHTAHLGASKMKQLARSYFWWPGLDSDIENIVKICDYCMENRNSPPKAELHPWIWPEKPWNRIHIDYAGPIRDTYFLIIVDSHSKWVEILPTKSITSSATIVLLRSCFARFGLPMVVVSDNGPAFVSSEFSNYLASMGVRHVRTAPYHPSSNGLAENMVKTFKSACGKFEGGGIQEKLDKFLFKYRITPHCTTGIAPTELMLGRKVRTVFDLIKPITAIKVKVTEKQKENYSKGKRMQWDILPNENVTIRNYGQGPKWVPAIIEKQTGPVTYKCKTENGTTTLRHKEQIWKDERKPVTVTAKNEELEVPVPNAENVKSREEPILENLPLRRSQRTPRPPDRLNL